MKSSSSEESAHHPDTLAHILVVGGANMDFKARTLAPAIPGTSNPGQTRQSLGGVGRNIAENLARLGVPVQLISAVGQDALGELLLRETAQTGVNVGGVLRSTQAHTGTYTAVLDHTGELLIAVADMQIMQELTPEALTERCAQLDGAAWIVADGNLSAKALTQLLNLAAQAGVKVIYEPVSVPKAAQLWPALRAGLPPHTVTPNLDELSTLTGRDVPDEPEHIHSAAQLLHRQGLQTVWIRRGAQGSVLSTLEGFQTFPASTAQVVDVTGAGDAMLAAYLAALMHGRTPLQAVPFAHAAAALTIESPWTVVPELSLRLVEERGLRKEKRGVRKEELR